MTTATYTVRSVRWEYPTPALRVILQGPRGAREVKLRWQSLSGALPPGWLAACVAAYEEPRVDPLGARVSIITR